MAATAKVRSPRSQQYLVRTPVPPVPIVIGSADGVKTALELTKKTHRVTCRIYRIGSDGVGASRDGLAVVRRRMVTSIDGFVAPTGYFWQLFVNGAPARVGADMLVPAIGQVVSWSVSRLQTRSRS